MLAAVRPRKCELQRTDQPDAATGLCLLGAAWTAAALTILGGPPGARTTALAIFLLMR